MRIHFSRNALIKLLREAAPFAKRGRVPSTGVELVPGEEPVQFSYEDVLTQAAAMLETWVPDDEIEGCAPHP